MIFGDTPPQVRWTCHERRTDDRRRATHVGGDRPVAGGRARGVRPGARPGANPYRGGRGARRLAQDRAAAAEPLAGAAGEGAGSPPTDIKEGGPPWPTTRAWIS